MERLPKFWALADLAILFANSGNYSVLARKTRQRHERRQPLAIAPGAGSLIGKGSNMGYALIAIVVIFPSASQTLPNDVTSRLIAAARSQIGTRYEIGGRLRNEEGLDCQGLLFYAAERISDCGWKSFSTRPTESVAHGELGDPVDGMDPVAVEDLDVSRLRPGDILLLVDPDQNPKEPAIGELQGKPVWVWHTGLYTGNGNWIVGDHIHGRVVEVPLVKYLEAATYTGVFVTRMHYGPQPRRCRQHRPMGE